MKIMTLVLLVSILATGTALAQSYYQKETTLYAEFFGWGGEASANLEKLIGERIGLRAGIGFTGVVFADGLVVPFGLNMLIGASRNYLELGVGGTYIDFDENDHEDTFLNVQEDQVAATALIGYRFIGDYGFSYRLGFTPAWTKDGFQAMGGAAFGYSF